MIFVVKSANFKVGVGVLQMRSKSTNFLNEIYDEISDFIAQFKLYQILRIYTRKMTF